MNIVCIGGGHGLAQVLSALKTIPCNLTAIVTTTDNGGSTGRLRADHSQIALGDIRRCAGALADQDLLLSVLSEQRFTLDNDLNGHAFGNILLSALCQATNNINDAIELFCTLLGVTHTVLPMSNSPVDLVATLPNGSQVYGECDIDLLSVFPESVALSKTVLANRQAVTAIIQADLILLGPGSLLTSVMPPLLLPEIQSALGQTSGCRMFIENLTLEQSVAAQIPAEQQAYKAMEMLGYKFFDVCLTPDAFAAMDLRTIPKPAPSAKHNKSQLKYIIEQLIPHSEKRQQAILTRPH